MPQHKLSPKGRSLRPQPLSLEPGRAYEEYGHSWNTFRLKFGTPPKSLEVHPATSSSKLQTALPEICANYTLNSCDNLNETYHPNYSSTWLLESERDDDYYVEGSVSHMHYYTGYDDVFIGSHRLANITTFLWGPRPRYETYVGLKPESGGDVSQTFVSALRLQEIIPSLSWALYGGNPYTERNASLVLGGYDATLTPTPDDIPQFDMQRDNLDSALNNELVANLVSITTEEVPFVSLNSSYSQVLSGENTNQLLDSPLPVRLFVDTNITLSLPERICSHFEKYFYLTWNNDLEMYLVDEQKHKLFMASNQTISLTFGYGDSVGDRHTNETITIPYASLIGNSSSDSNHQVDPQLVFSLARAQDPSESWVGAALFQWSYLIADYERQKFSLQQVNSPNGSHPDIRTISPLVETNSTSSALEKINANSRKSAIIGGTIGGAVLLVVVVAACVCFTRRYKRSSKASRFIFSGKPELPAPDAGIAGLIKFEKDVTERGYPQLEDTSFTRELPPNSEATELRGSNVGVEVQAEEVARELEENVAECELEGNGPELVEMP